MTRGARCEDAILLKNWHTDVETRRTKNNSDESHSREWRARREKES